MTESATFIGIDAGRTKTALRLSNASGSRFVTVNGPGINVQHVGPAGAADVLIDLLREAAHVSTIEPPVFVSVGLAGGGRQTDIDAVRVSFDAQRSELPQSLQDVSLDLVDDGVIALQAALDDDSGLAVIVGTGSLVLGRRLTGEVVRAGGWGSLLGDEGSGYALGLAGLRAVARALDGGPKTALRRHLALEFGFGDRSSIIAAVYQEQWPLQLFAPFVVRAAGEGDAIAAAIVQRQVQKLVDQIAGLIARAPDAFTKRIAFIGGLLNEPAYADALRNALHEQLPEWDASRCAVPAVDGALELARRMGETA
ncbi:MAG: BadF/BadG/BcrA/BcrD ATPase family protein [Bacteroidota bacterium]